MKNNNNEKTIKQEKKVAKKEVKKVLDKAGVVKRNPVPKVPKNIRSSDSERNKELTKKHYSGLVKSMKDGSCMPNDAVRYMKLVDNPFTAEWGDEGETPVRPLVYQDAVPPSGTTVMRNYGTAQVQVSAGTLGWMAFPFGGSCLMANDGANTTSVAHYDTHYSNWSVVRVDNVPNYKKYTFGAPYDGRNDTNGLGVAGYGYLETSTTAPPLSNLYNGASLPMSATTTGGPTIFNWGNTETLGPMSAESPGIYSYRPIAGGVRITPLDDAVHIGGAIESFLIPTASNEAYCTTSSPLSPPSVGGIAKLAGLPNHTIKRGDKIFETRWLPGELDYDFYQTVNGATIVQPDAGRDQFENRFWIRITPGDAAAASRYRVEYVGFYEISGSTVEKISSVPRPLPNVGAKITTAIQNVTQTDLQQSVRRNQVQDSSMVEVMKDHPTVGPLIVENKTVAEVESTFDKIVDSVGSVLGVVGPLIGAIL